MNPNISIEENPCRATVILDSSVYQKEAVAAAAYGQFDIYGVQIQADKQNLEVVFVPKTPLASDRIHQDMLNFLNDAIDEQLRLQIVRQAGHLREIIVEHAFRPILGLQDRLSEKI